MATCFVNKFPGRCNNSKCPNGSNRYNGVLQGEGYTIRDNGTYTTYCKDCTPSKPDPIQNLDQPRKLTKEGHIITPYEPQNLTLLRSFPGAKFHGNKNGQPCFACKGQHNYNYWQVSLALENRERVLELATRLGLDVDASLKPAQITQEALKAHTEGLYPFQVKGVQFLSIGTHRLLGDEMGCIDGDALVQVNRGGGSGKVKLSHLYHKFNGGRSRNKNSIWDLSIPTYTRSFCNGEVRLHKISAVLDKGIKQVVQLTLKSGKSLRLTPDHEVLCLLDGEHKWVEAERLRVGDVVLTNGKPKCKACGSTERVAGKDPYAKFPGYCMRCIYRKMRKQGGYKTGRTIGNDGTIYLSGYYDHPRITSNGMPEHVLVAEKMLGRRLVDGEEVHHKNRNHQDNRPENLEVLTKEEHMRLHGLEGGYKNLHGGSGKRGDIFFLPVEDTVVSVEPDGEAHVYDIVCDDPHRNFVANGIIVHNCGKTVQSLRSLPVDARALVVCPASLKLNWQDECQKWRPDLAATVLSGKENFRYPNMHEVIIVNYDMLPDYLNFTKEKPAEVSSVAKLMLAQTVLIVDEAHNCGGKNSIRTKKITTLSKHASKVWFLTGTPMTNRQDKLISILSAGNMLEKTFGTFGRAYKFLGAIKGRWGTEWGMPLPEAAEMLRTVMLRRSREEVLPDLPTKTYTDLTVNGLTPSMITIMNELYDEWEADLAAGNLPPFTKMAAIRAMLATSRIPIMEEYVQNCEEQDVPLVVASAHKAPILALQNREGWAVITGEQTPEERQQVVKDFQSGKLKGVGLTIQAGGVGLTLTRAWRMLFVDLDWTPALNEQCEDRICRIGQESNKCEIVRMVSNHPLDQRVTQLLSVKKMLSNATLNGKVEVTLPTEGLATQLGLDPKTAPGIVLDLAKEEGLIKELPVNSNEKTKSQETAESKVVSNEDLPF